MLRQSMAGAPILVVEDNEVQSTLVRFLLEEAGHTVQTAESAEQAQEILHSFSPDLVLMDLQLPGMDGLELTRLLRLSPVHAATPIVALTSYTDASDLERAHEAGCNAHISKPIDTETFVHQVGRYLNHSAVAPANAPCDSRDLLSELRNTFLAEGLEQCTTILRDLQSGPGCTIEVIQRVLHRWAGLGGTLGFPEVSNQARRVEALLTQTELRNDEIERALETTLVRFRIATRNKPRLPLELITALSDVRIGLIHFSQEEADRIRAAAHHATIQVAIEQLKDHSIEDQAGYDALIINECAISTSAALPSPRLSVPAVFIGSRSSLESLSRLPVRGYDFLIAPWDAEEILMRAYRLIAKAPQHQPGPDLPAVSAKRPRVLIADDDPCIVATVFETLQQFEMDCDIARGGKQALLAATQCPPDAIILDVNMFDIDGFEVLNRLRRNLVTTSIPVLLLTARRQESDIARGFQLGANDYVVKPFKPIDLVKRVERMISASRK